MTALRAFFSMGGYAAYVWPAFATAAVVLRVLLLASRRRWRANAAALASLQAARPGRRGTRATPGGGATPVAASLAGDTAPAVHRDA